MAKRVIGCTKARNSGSRRVKSHSEACAFYSGVRDLIFAIRTLLLISRFNMPGAVV